jgi:signal transduction histidine kinase
VRDNGPGIGADEQAHLFEPFFTTKERGLGLGLPICSTILRRHGGTLSLENNDGHGVTAFLRLPIRPNGVPVS